MSRFEGILQTVDDRANPVVVKELRQAVQNRMVITVLLLSLLVNVIITSAFLALSSEVLSGQPAGENLYQTLYGFLVCTCMVFVPLYAALRMTLERNNTNIDLLFITTIPPAAIVRGKFWAAVALTALIYSACLPFLSFTYLLRGIDLPSIFLSLTFSFLCTMLSIMAAIFVGSISGGMLLRFLMALGLLYFGGILMGMTVAMGMVIVQSGLGSILGTTTSWIVAIVSLVWGLLGLTLFYLLAVAAISAKTSNRMFPLRIFITACWALWGGVTWVWSWIESDGTSLTTWMVASCIVLSMMIGLLPCERESWTPRVRRTIPRSPVPRFCAWLFYTGSAGGMVWSILLVLTTLGVFVLYSRIYAGHFRWNLLDDLFPMIPILLLYSWCYTMSGVLLRRWLAPQSSPVLATVLGVVLLGLGGTIPLFIAYTILGMKNSIHELPTIFIVTNPFAMMDDQVDQGVVLVFLAVWAVVGLLLNLPWFRQQWRGFQRYEPAVSSELSSSVSAVEAPGVSG